jgi:glycosyltransferase involved in cell wall biosynthesis
MPNFVRPLTARLEEQQPLNRWVVASRLTPEKGVLKLIQSLPNDVELDVYGSGPEMRKLSRIATPNVRLMGHVSQEQLQEALPRYEGMLFPSGWWEGIPGAVLMALQAGIPVVARAGSSGADLVLSYGLGAVYEGNEISDAISRVRRTRLDINRDEFKLAEVEFSESTWLERTERCISELVGVRVG